MTGVFEKDSGRQQQLTPELIAVLKRAILPPTKHGPGPLSLELPCLRAILDPALLALDAYRYTLGAMLELG